MSRRWITLLLLSGALLQTLLPPWNVFSAMELPILTGLLIFIALHTERTEMFYAAVLTALLHDALCPAPVGLSIPFFVLLAAGIHRIHKEVFGDLFATYAIFGAGAALLDAVYYGLIFAVSDLRPVSFRFLLLRLAGGLIAGVLVIPLMALILSKFTRKSRTNRRAVYI
jgi:cell shape-determining protein MreD